LRRLAPAGSEVHVIDASAGPGWHISLGPLLLLRVQFVEPLLQKLRQLAGGLSLPLGSQAVSFDDSIEVLSSLDGGRYFAAVRVSEASEAWLRPLAASVLSAAKDLSLVPAAAESPIEDLRLHVSLAWTVADLQPGLAKANASCQESSFGRSWTLSEQTAEADASEGLLARPRAINVRVGERINALALPWARRLVDQSSEEEDEDPP
ncbi:unnamed protein product, partial [Polarella glacialis]